MLPCSLLVRRHRASPEIRLALAAYLLALCGQALAQGEGGCGSLANHFGPFDYRKASQDERRLVERFHFTPGVESLTKKESTYFGGDLTYTLRVFPNHPRALLTIQRLAEREKTDHPSNTEFSVSCFFDRAIRFQPEDTMVRMLYAQYLFKRQRVDDATKQLDEVIKIAKDEPFTHFNVGLIFLDMKNYDRALIQAHRASELGFPRTELKDGLAAVGKWREPSPTATASPKP
jgi:tetratricopeptide (TPR) repeat protein